MEGVEMIKKIREQLVKNEGKWDLQMITESLWYMTLKRT